MKPDPDLQALLASLELCRSTIDAASTQLTALEKQVRHLIRGKPGLGKPEVLKAQSISKVKAPKEKARPIQTPADSALVGVPCPSCQAPMEWRQNKTEKTWFAGCTQFSGRYGCRGTRTVENVEAWNEEERNGSSSNCTCRGFRKDPNCPVGQRFGNHPPGATMAQAAASSAPPLRETHVARSPQAVDLAARHMTTGFEGMMNGILEKHHGTEAVLDQYQTGFGGDLIVDDAGKPVRRDGKSEDDLPNEDPLGVPF